jgi:hypothetical protein
MHLARLVFPCVTVLLFAVDAGAKRHGAIGGMTSAPVRDPLSASIKALTTLRATERKTEMNQAERVETTLAFLRRLQNACKKDPYRVLYRTADGAKVITLSINRRQSPRMMIETSYVHGPRNVLHQVNRETLAMLLPDLTPEKVGEFLASEASKR